MDLYFESCGVSDAAARALIPVARGIDLRRNNLSDLRGLVGATTERLAWIGLTGNGGARTSDESNEGGVVIWSGSRDLYPVEIQEMFGFRADLQIR